MSLNAHHAYSALLTSAINKLRSGDGSPERREFSNLVHRLHARLSRPPRILLLGEVNSGKSTLANLLIGESVVPTSVVANTLFPLRFHFASKPTLSAHFEGGRSEALVWTDIEKISTMPVTRIDVGLALDRLKIFEVIDTPGTGNQRGDRSGFEQQLSLAHLPIWCTVATRAWKESERRVWARVAPSRKARGILVVTQSDLLNGAADLEKVIERLGTETKGLFHAIVPLALPEALKSSVVSPSAPRCGLWESSGGERLETVLLELLSDIAEQRVAAAKRALRSALARRGIVGGDGELRTRRQHAKPDCEIELVATLLSTNSLFHGIETRSDVAQDRNDVQASSA